MNIRILQKIIATTFPPFLFFATYAFASGSIPEREYVRPSNVPDNYIVTPNGYFHPSCVHEIKNDEIQSAGLIIERPNGEVRKIEKCNYSNYSKYGVERKLQDKINNEENIYDNWQLSAEYKMNNSLGQLQASWYVPGDPLVDQGQTLYFFPGVQQTPTVSILQPVLAWNDLGLKGWSLASWNCCEDGTIIHSTPIKTSAGQFNLGTINYDHGLGGYYIKSYTFDDISGLNSTKLRTRNYRQPVNWIFGGVMENYGVQSCDALSSSRSILFFNINVTDISGNIVYTPFNADGHGRYCNYNVTISKDGINSGVRLDF